MAEIDIHRAIGARAGGNHDAARCDFLLAAIIFIDLQGVLVNKASLALDHRDLIAVVEASAHIDLAFDHGASRLAKLRKGQMHPRASLAKKRILVRFEELMD